MHRLISHLKPFASIKIFLTRIAFSWLTVLKFLRAAVRCFPYPPTHEQHDAKKKTFIDSIERSAVINLASRYNGQKVCSLFGSNQGSFNACFFVEFPDDGTRWVVRVPVEPAVDDVWAKVQREVALYGQYLGAYIQTKTTIPVPSVHAFGQHEVLTSDRSASQAFLILDYVPGQSLDVESLAKDTRARRDHFYAQLVDILAQLRQLEFPSSGSLMLNMGGRGEPKIGPFVSIPSNQLEVQGAFVTRPAIFTRPIDFLHHQLDVLAQTYEQPVSEQTLERAQMEVFALEQLRGGFLELACVNWESGPFVLSHQDLRWPNIMVDDALNILAVIDWEWAGTIPHQLFMPPYWIAGREPQYVRGDAYHAEYTEFYRVLVAKSDTSDSCRLLAAEWKPERVDCLLPFAEVLRHQSHLTEIFYRAMFPQDVVAGKAMSDFFDRPENEELDWKARRSFRSSERYTQWLKDHGLYVTDRATELNNALAQKMEKLRQQLEKAGHPLSAV